MARFEQQRVLQSIANPRTGEAQGTLAVADTLQTFGKWGMEQYRKKRIVSAVEEAQAVEPSTQAPAMRSDMTETGQAYNEIVLAGHAAAIKVDYSRHIGELSMQYQNDPQGFDNAAMAYKAEMMNNVAPELRAAVSTDYDAATIRPSLSIRDTFQKNQVISSANDILQASNVFLDDVAKAARAGDLEVMNHNVAAIERLAETLDELGRPQEAQQLLDGMNAQIDKQIVLGRAEDAIQAGKGASFIQNFIDNPPEDLTPDQVDSYASTMVAMDNRYQSLIKEQQAGVSIETQRTISNLEIAAKNGLLDPEEITAQTEALFDQGLITPAKRTSIFNDILANEKKRQKEATDFSSVALRLSGDDSIFVEPKLQDEYFEKAVMPTLANADPQSAQMVVVDYVQRMKRVPTALKNQLSTFIQSDNPDRVAEAARMVDKIDDIPGLAKSVFSTEQQAFATNVLNLMANMTPEEAVAQARKLTDPNDQVRIEARKTNLEAMRKGGFGVETLDYTEEVRDLFNPIFGGTQVDALAEANLTKEYKTLVDQYYLAGMEIDAARAKAEQTLNRNWSVWNGNAMKYAPDKYYQVAGSTDYIIDQLYSDVNKEIVMDEPIRKADLRLVATEETARTASTGAPVYRVVIVKDGNITPLHGFHWSPDVARETKRVERANKKLLEEVQQEAEFSQPAFEQPLDTGRGY